ncbi:MAG: hypothetical protein A2046_13545 [Bacteroidetes bacterium GWA2_30_7]|nr:MAG: hypothetical protein A2046_13545 [Bacteroidetes bacterium GWA2_30_7]
MKSEVSCKQNILYQNQNGYVIKCKECNHFKVAFGTFCITQTVPEFFEFMVKIYKIRESYKNQNICPEYKCIEVPTPLRNMSWIFNMNDINNLVELLEQACKKIEIEKNFCNN